MQIVAKAKYVRGSPRKVGLILDLVRGCRLNEALSIVALAPRRASKAVEKVLRSGLSDAKGRGIVDIESLYVKRAQVDRGPMLKRFIPRAFGRATRIRKRTSHITVVLEEKE